MAEKIVATPVKAEKLAPVFSKADLIASAAVLGTTPAILTGALYGKKDELTREEAEKAVKDFLAHPVQKTTGGK